MAAITAQLRLPVRRCAGRKVGEAPITPDFVLKLGFAAGKVLARSGSRKVLIE
jgi:phosphomannomutase